MKQYDLCIIGGGPAGYAAAMRAIDFGKRVALIEKDKIGGYGIFNGALSSKTLWQLSLSYKNIRSNRIGCFMENDGLKFSNIMNEMEKACYERFIQLQEQVNYFVKKGKLDFVQGYGTFKSKNEINIEYSDKSNEVIFADNTIIATGSRPRKLPNIPIDEEIILTSDGIDNLKDFPKSLVILGAGVIGCEFATIFSNFGKTKVYLIDKAERILPFEDEDIANSVAHNLEKNGVHIHRNSSLEKMEVVDNMVRYSILLNDGRREIYTVEKALVSVGRVINSNNIGLESIGVDFDERGSIRVDDDTQTSVPNIYAIGDTTADISLVNIAELEGRHAVEKIFSNPDSQLVYSNISTIMFLNPAVAGVGMNEIQARKKGIPYRMALMDYRYVARSIAMRAKDGFVKILVTDDDEMNVLGMRVIGRHASNAVDSIALLIKMNKSIRELAELVHAHPSISEGIQECARMLLGKSIIKPEVFNLQLKCYRVDSNGQIEDLYKVE